MSALIQTIFLLTGILAGKTIRLGKWLFTDGVLTLNATPEETALVARALERNWQAYPKGHPALATVTQEPDDGKRDLPPGPSGTNGESDVSGGVQPNGTGPEAGSEAGDGGGAAEPEAGQAAELAQGDGQPQGVSDVPAADANPFAKASPENPVVAEIEVGDGSKLEVMVVGQEADGSPVLDADSAAALEAAMKPKDAPAKVEDPKAEVNTKLVKAIHKLDPKDDSHWTGAGLPAMVAVEGFYGSADITRADVEAAAPGYTRATASK